MAKAGDGLDIAAAGAREQPRSSRSHGAGALPGESGPHGFGCGDDHRQQLLLGGAGSPTAARRAVSRICSAARSAPVLGSVSRVRARGVAGGAFGVDRIGLRPGSARRALGPVQFDDQLAAGGQVPGACRRR
jgi:hypothetical protein